MHTKTYCIAMTGGGSGGHVFPALAVLEELQQLDIHLKVLWIGSKNGIEKDIIENYRSELSAKNLDCKINLYFCGISCGKLRRYFSWQNFSDIFRIALGFVQSLLLLKREGPLLVFSKGGFVSVPPILAARLLGIKSLAHESDLDPGLATKLALPLVKKLYLPYEHSRKFFAKKYWQKLEISGNPVRKEFFACNADNGLLPTDWYDSKNAKKLRRPLILVLGGSLGAKEINDYVYSLLEPSAEDYYIVHQCGEHLRQLDFPHYKAFSFISSGLGYLYQLCRESGGLVLSRAGAGTLWEILASRNKAILLPLQSGSRGDQLRNAKFFVEQGWAYCFLPEHEKAGQQRNVAKLLAQIRVILQDRQNRESSQKKCDAPSIPNAAKIIANSIWEELNIEG